MIRIYKDKDQKYVTKGAYETFYKPLGYKTIIEEKTSVQLDEEVRPTRRTRGSSKKNIEGEANDLSN